MVDPESKARSDAAKSRAKERNKRWSYAGYGIGMAVALLLGGSIYASGSLSNQMATLTSLALVVVVPYVSLLIASGIANRLSDGETVRINQDLDEAERSRRER
jgi:hypothetical protein